MRRWRLPAAALAMLLVAQSAASVPPRIAIIIDDLGYQLAAGRRAIELPGPVACAILPRTPRGPALARFANARGKEVLLHLPLEAVAKTGRADADGIVLEMSRTELQETFRDAIASVPFAVGVSSHRGSLLTRHPGHMQWLMQAIAARGGLFFIDSYTTTHSIALQMAAETGIAAARRDVFLDSDRSRAAVLAELERLKALARERGRAVAIGHPYPETLEVLERELPGLSDEGIELVPLGTLLGETVNPGERPPSNPAR
jgi:hypothetical protein